MPVIVKRFTAPADLDKCIEQALAKKLYEVPLNTKYDLGRQGNEYYVYVLDLRHMIVHTREQEDYVVNLIEEKFDYAMRIFGPHIRYEIIQNSPYLVARVLRNERPSSASEVINKALSR